MSFGLLFSGQGMQHAAMLPWLGEDALTRAVGACLGVRHWRDSLADPARAQRNAVAQPLLAGIGLSAWRQLSAQVGAPAAVAGYSVGELAAFSAAGVLDASRVVELAALRAAAMDRCALREPGGLIAISGLAAAALQSLLAQTGLAVAIRNGPENLVLGGPVPALERAGQIARAQGAHGTRLRVELASHTPWMHDAALAFAQALAAESLQAPATLLFSNAQDRVRDAAGARQALSTQIATTVRWDECMDQMAARQLGCVLEIGPGQALARLWSQRHPHIPARSGDDFRSIAAIAAWLRRHDGA